MRRAGVELPAPPDVVWDELPGILGDEVELAAEPGGRLHTDGPDGERVGVVDEAVPAERLRSGGSRPTATTRRRTSRSRSSRRRSARSCACARRASTARTSCVRRSRSRSRVPEARRDARRPTSSTRSPTPRAAGSSSASAARRRPRARSRTQLPGVAPGRREAPRACSRTPGLVRGERDGRRVVFRLTPGPFARSRGLDARRRRGVGPPPRQAGAPGHETPLTPGTRLGARALRCRPSVSTGGTP